MTMMHRRTILTLAPLLLGLASAACASEPTAPPQVGSPPGTAAKPKQPPPKESRVAKARHARGKPRHRRDTEEDEKAWLCTGELVPPSGWQQETVLVPIERENASQLAVEAAVAGLAARLCPAASEQDCAFIRSRIVPWRIGAGEKNACAMAVISDSDWSDWLKRSATVSQLDEGLSRAAGELLAAAKPTDHVAIDTITDLGIPGGDRADWLRGHMEAFLGARAKLVELPKGWSGRGVPRGVDWAISCKVFARSELGVAVLDAQWTALSARGDRRSSAPVTFPASAAPAGPQRGELTTYPADAKVSVHLDARRGGSVCAGDRTQIWLETAEPLHVRVLNLYGTREALMLYPNSDIQPSPIPPHEVVAIGGPLGFEAVPVPGSQEERFLVIAAPTEAGLGRFASARGPCRVTADMAASLHAGALPAGVFVSTTGYRLSQGPDCPPPPSAAQREGVVTALGRLPICNF